MRRVIFGICFGLLLTWAEAASALTINLVFGDGFPLGSPGQQVAFAAKQFWEKTISFDYTVTITLARRDLSGELNDPVGRTYNNEETPNPDPRTGTFLPVSANIDLTTSPTEPLWFDPTPGDNSEFFMTDEHGRFGNAFTAPLDSWDALSVLCHEFGHAIGCLRVLGRFNDGELVFPYSSMENNFFPPLAPNVYGFDWLQNGQEGNVSGANGARTTIPFDADSHFDSSADPTLSEKLMAAPSFTIGQRSLPTALDIDVIVDAFRLPQDEYDDVTLPVAAVPKDEGEGGGSTGLHECMPNPTTGTSQIVFSLPSYASMRLDVIDLEGRRTRSLIRGNMPAGTHFVEWNGMDDWHVRALPGIYFVQLTVDGKVSGQRRLVVLR